MIFKVRFSYCRPIRPIASLVVQLALMPQEEGGIVQSHHTCSISEAH